MNTHNNDEQTASGTLDEMGSAVKKDVEATKEHVKDAADWVTDKAKEAKDGFENEAEEAGLNDGDPDKNDD